MNLITNVTRQADWSIELHEIFSNFSSWKARQGLLVEHTKVEIWDCEAIDEAEERPARIRLLRSSQFIPPMSSTAIRLLCQDANDPTFESQMSVFVLSWERLKEDSYFANLLTGRDVGMPDK